MNDQSAQIDPEVEAAISSPFPGTPATYLRIAVLGTIAIHVYLFAGYWAIKTFLAGEAWPTSWVPLAATVASAAFFSRLAYRWIMRLDAQYGRSSGWVQVTTTVKLPWERPRKKKP
ncbi:MAG: hypothetical protein KGL48_02700 [Sphingomonadales bacterium]|nr:hypothetical protein [Sphingomonadales bacterium]MDE2568444.1 hypothetical protein [Sphingomonadales bacterium]